MPTLNGIDYERLPGYPQENISADYVEVTDGFRCAWADRTLLSRQLLGYTSGSIIHLPHEYDFGSDLITGIYCRKVSVGGIAGRNVGLDPDTGNYKYAEIIAQYTSPDWEQPEEEEEVLYSETIEPSAELMTMPVDLLYWDAGKTEEIKDTEVPTALIRRLDWVLTIHHATTWPSGLLGFVGCINNSTIYSSALKYTFEYGRVLYLGANLEREITTFGTTAWTITLHFTYSPQNDWNYLPKFTDQTDTTTLQFSRIFNEAGTAKRIYPYANLLSLLP